MSFHRKNREKHYNLIQMKLIKLINYFKNKNKKQRRLIPNLIKMNSFKLYMISEILFYSEESNYLLNLAYTNIYRISIKINFIENIKTDKIAFFKFTQKFGCLFIFNVYCNIIQQNYILYIYIYVYYSFNFHFKFTLL